MFITDELPAELNIPARKNLTILPPDGIQPDGHFDVILCPAADRQFPGLVGLLKVSRDLLTEDGLLAFSAQFARKPLPFFRFPRSLPEDIQRLCSLYYRHFRAFDLGEEHPPGGVALFACSDVDDFPFFALNKLRTDAAEGMESSPGEFIEPTGEDERRIKSILVRLGADEKKLSSELLKNTWQVLTLSDAQSTLRKIEALLSEEKTYHQSVAYDDNDPPEEPLNILLLCWEPPTPTHGGGVVMTNYIKQLSRNHTVSVITNIYRDKNIEEMRGIEPLVERLISVPRDLCWQPSLCPVKDAPYWLKNQYSPYIHQITRDDVKNGAYDIVQYEYLPMAIYPVDGVPTTLIKHDIMYRSFIEIAENKLVPENLLPGIWASALQCFLFEVSTDRLGFSAEIVFTHQDAEDQLRFNPELPLFVNPFGVDADSFPARRDMPGSDLLYVGNYLHYPNRQAVMAIALEILPKVRRFSPETEFHVAGSFMRKDLEEVLAAHENIVVEGFVPSLIDTYHRAAVFVSPIFTGRGMRVKHLEVLSCGLTLITTERGMAGIDLPEGKAWLRAETAEEFVEKILWCLSNPFASIEIGKNAAELIRQRYTWEHRTKAFLSIIKRILTSRDGDEQ